MIIHFLIENKEGFHSIKTLIKVFDIDLIRRIRQNSIDGWNYLSNFNMLHHEILNV